MNAESGSKRFPKPRELQTLARMPRPATVLPAAISFDRGTVRDARDETGIDAGYIIQISKALNG